MWCFCLRLGQLSTTRALPKVCTSAQDLEEESRLEASGPKRNGGCSRIGEVGGEDGEEGSEGREAREETRGCGMRGNPGDGGICVDIDVVHMGGD